MASTIPVWRVFGYYYRGGKRVDFSELIQAADPTAAINRVNEIYPGLPWEELRAEPNGEQLMLFEDVDEPR
ncbi:MAG: hypothetical protein ACOC9V_06135 [Chloroflexota bacterium]